MDSISNDEYGIKVCQSSPIDRIVFKWWRAGLLEDYIESVKKAPKNDEIRTVKNKCMTRRMNVKKAKQICKKKRVCIGIIVKIK